MNFENTDQLISLASWEDRFLLGAKIDLERTNAKEWSIFYLEEFESLSRKNIDAACEYAEAKGVSARTVKLQYANIRSTWERIVQIIEDVPQESSVLVDYSTMTREVMWMTLQSLTKLRNRVDHVYWSPEKTSPWTSKNSIRPRLVAGRAGISLYGRPTLLAVAPGFDASRLDQLSCYFEPEITQLFLQVGEQFDNHENNLFKYSSYPQTKERTKAIEIDAYSRDYGLEIIENYISPYIDSHNIVLGSHGPKPSAIAMHYLQEKYPTIGLVYTPALHFNENYSSGIGDFYLGNLTH